jgi:hypothetical protein
MQQLCNMMTGSLEQIEEEILISPVSDEALEAAGGPTMGGQAAASFTSAGCCIRDPHC